MKYRAENFKTFDELANSIGAVPALTLCSFFANTTVYIPDTPPHGHLIEKLIGLEAFTYLCRSHGSQTLNIPSLELLSIRRAGRLYQLQRLGASDGLAANLLGLSKKHVQGLKAELATFEITNDEDA